MMVCCMMRILCRLAEYAATARHADGTRSENEEVFLCPVTHGLALCCFSWS